jgi:tetratricopeptide (TPR) repeat protein
VISGWIALAIALAAEAASVAQVLSTASLAGALPRALVIHAAAALLVGWAAGAHGTDRSRTIRGAFAAAMAFLGLPVFGAVAMASSWIASTVVGRRRGASAEIDEDTADDYRVSPARPDLHTALDVVPLVDLLHGRDPDLKRGAMEALVGMYGLGAAPGLQALLRDDDPEVRLYASIRLSGLEDEMGRAIQAERAAIQRSPSDLEACRRLVLATTDYVSSGLLDKATARQYLLRAEEAFDVLAQVQPEHGALALALGRACQAAQQHGAARDYFERAARANETDLTINARLGLMELAFAQRALTEVQTYATELALDMPTDDPRRAAVDWWAERA